VPVTRVLVADDGHLIRAALIELLRTEGDVESVADTGDGRQVLPLARWPVPAGPSPS
jgi:two-component system response regulator DesR